MQTSTKKKSQHYCYLLHSPSTGKTYFGYTVDPKRRLRQHNGEIVGGAKRTKKNRPWVMICYISGFPDNHKALQFEWKNNHPTKGNKSKKRGYRIDKLTAKRKIGGKLDNLTRILAAEQWTGNAVKANTIPLCVHWLSDNILSWKKINIEKPTYITENRKT